MRVMRSFLTSDWMTLLLLKLDASHNPKAFTGQTESASAVTVKLGNYSMHLTHSHVGGVSLNRLFHTACLECDSVVNKYTKHVRGGKLTSQLSFQGNDKGLQRSEYQIPWVPHIDSISDLKGETMEGPILPDEICICNNRWWYLQAKLRKQYTAWNAFLFINRCFHTYSFFINWMAFFYLEVKGDQVFSCHNNSW